MVDGKLRNMTSVYILDGDRILLLYRVGSRVVSPSWCGIGGHFMPEELGDARACALRELEEESGLGEGDLLDLRLRYITLRQKNGETRQNYFFFARLRPGSTVPATSSEGQLRWFSLGEIAALPMPLTAGQMLAHYLHTGRHTRLLYGGITTPEQLAVTPLEDF